MLKDYEIDDSREFHIGHSFTCTIWRRDGKTYRNGDDFTINLHNAKRETYAITPANQREFHAGESCPLVPGNYYSCICCGQNTRLYGADIALCGSCRNAGCEPSITSTQLRFTTCQRPDLETR